MMRRYLVTFSIAALFPAGAFAAKYEIDPAHTYANFSINHLGFSDLFGRFERTKGSFVVDPQGKQASVVITIDAESIDTGHAKRDDRLRSPDFFNAVEFPEISFQSTDAVWDGDAIDTIEGDLIMLGVTKPVTLQVTHMHCGVHPFNKKEACGFNAEATVTRSDWGVTYGVPNIGDEIRLMLGVEGFKVE